MSTESTMLVRERETQEGLLVSVCDRELLGEEFSDGNVSLAVTEDFYDGDPTDEGGVVDSLARATVANIVGTRAVQVAIDAGFVEEGNVLEVESTRHAQMLRMA